MAFQRMIALLILILSAVVSRSAASYSQIGMPNEQQQAIQLGSGIKHRGTVERGTSSKGAHFIKASSANVLHYAGARPVGLPFPDLNGLPAGPTYHMAMAFAWDTTGFMVRL